MNDGWAGLALAVTICLASGAVAAPATIITKLPNGYEQNVDKDDGFEDHLLGLTQKTVTSADFKRVRIGLVVRLLKEGGEQPPKFFIDVSLPAPYHILDFKRAGGGDFDYERGDDSPDRKSETITTVLTGSDIAALRAGQPLRFKIAAPCRKGQCSYIGTLDPIALRALDEWAAGRFKTK